MSAFDLTCSNLTGLVTEYLEFALAPDDELSYELHLVYCGECRVFLTQIREVVRGLNELPPEPGDEPDRALVLNAFRGRS